MFFPDKAKAFAEAQRVLDRGGVFVFNVWDALSENEFPDTITTALASVFPADPPRFLARVPYGYYDHDVIARDLASGGFTAPPEIETVEARSRAASARDPAVAFCQGTPLRSEIEQRGAPGLAEATNVAADAIARRFGPGPVDGKISAHVFVVRRDA
jgi:SAM-dependent methyltransferase